MKKRILAALMIAAMVLGLAACGSKSETQTSEPAAAEEGSGTEEAPAAEDGTQNFEGIELTVWMAPNKSVDADKAFWDSALKGFEEETGAKINVEIVNWSELATKQRTGYMSGNIADVMYVCYPHFCEMGDQLGIYEVLDDYWTDEELEQELYWDAVEFNGKHYGAPLVGIDPRVYTFNMDILKECGINEPPTTWDELMETCKAIKEKKPDIYAFLTPLMGDHMLYSGPFNFIYQAGGAYCSDDGQTCTMDSPEVHDALAFMKEMMDKDYWSSDALGMDLDSVVDLFAQGKAAITCVLAPQTYFADVDFEWIGTTAMKKERDAVFGSIDCITISSISPHKDAAIALLKYIRTPEVMEQYKEEIYPANAQLVTTWPELEIDPRVADAYEHPERIFNNPACPFITPLNESVRKNVQMVLSGEISIEEAQANMMADAVVE